MKTTIPVIIFVVISLNSFAQQDEFKIHDNGLIYDATTMKKLGAIVDSLNLKFRSCDLSHPYYSYPQGKAIHVQFKGKNKDAQNDIRKGMSITEFTKKYSSAKYSETWIYKYSYESYNKERFIEFETFPGARPEFSIRVPDTKKNDKSSGWILSTYDEEVEAFYVDYLASVEVPVEYARLVQYVDCMVDTTAEIYFPEAESLVYQRVVENSKGDQFIKWASKFDGEPTYPDYEKLNNDEFKDAYDLYKKQYEDWNNRRLAELDKKIDKSHYWKSLLMDARDEAFADHNSDDRLEFYVGRYISKEDALKMKRSRKVMGNCSQDQSPRFHAMNICQLAAETTKWDIFLRSHLDIMNDRFERQSDGSYAWGARKTYLKELEELDIAATDLLLGISLRVTNTSDNHYWGSIGRVGRALADTEDKDKLEQKILGVIKDPKLDTFNRLLFVYLFNNYNYYLESQTRKDKNTLDLKEAMASLPAYAQRNLEK